MPHLIVELEIPGDLGLFKLPPAVDDRLRDLLDRQDRGEMPTAGELREAEELVDLAEVFSLLRLLAQRASREEMSE